MKKSINVAVVYSKNGLTLKKILNKIINAKLSASMPKGGENNS